MPPQATAIPAATKLGPKVVISIGGWNFPSSYFSTMASSAASRGKFIASIQKWVTQYSLAGVDLDWEYPCSPARANPVKISCAKFQNVADTGGNCPGDTANLLSLVKEMRQALGPDKLISLASQVRAASRSIPPHGGQFDFVWLPHTYAPWGCIVRVVSLTKSRRIPTRCVHRHR